MVKKSTALVNITITGNADALLKTVNEAMTDKAVMQSVAMLTKSNVIRLSKMHLRNRFTRGGKADGCPAWIPNAPSTLDWESKQPQHAPDYTLPLVFTGRARSMLAPVISHGWIPETGIQIPIYSGAGGECSVSQTGFQILSTLIFPKYMVYHQYGYTTKWKGKPRRVPARPWFLWASAYFDGAGINLFRRITRRAVLDYASTIFAFIKRRFKNEKRD